MTLVCVTLSRWVWDITPLSKPSGLAAQTGPRTAGKLQSDVGLWEKPRVGCGLGRNRLLAGGQGVCDSEGDSTRQKTSSGRQSYFPGTVGSQQGRCHPGSLELNSEACRPLGVSPVEWE